MLLLKYHVNKMAIHTGTLHALGLFLCFQYSGTGYQTCSTCCECI